MASAGSFGRRTADLFWRAVPRRGRAPITPNGRSRGDPVRSAPNEGPLARVPETVIVDDLVFHIDHRHGSVAPSVAAGDYEAVPLALLRRRLSPGDTFVDVGASFGYVSTQIGRHLGPRGTVVAFEPGRQHHSLLLLNLAANGVLSAEVHPIALANRQGLLWYRDLGSTGVVSPFDGNALGLAHHDLVQCSTLDRELGGRTVHAVRIDVAGAEGLVLLGARGVLRSSTPMVVLRFDPVALAAVSKMSGRDVLELFSGLGYVVGVADHPDAHPEALTPDVVAARADAAGRPLQLVAWSALRE